MEGRKGTIFTVFSTAYAVGKTLLSLNMAAELAKLGHNVCLVDLDLQFGDISYYLNLVPKKTIADAQREIEDVKEHPVKEYMTPFEANGVAFDVLCRPLKLEEAYNMDVSFIRSLISRLQVTYEYVVIDTTSQFSPLNLAVMDMSTMVQFVGIVDFIPTIKNMKRGSDSLKELGFDETKLRYILNRSNAKTKIKVGDVESIMGKQFEYTLPNDFKVAQESLVSGIPLVLSDHKSDLGVAIHNLVSRYTGRGEEAENTKRTGSWLSKLFS